MITYPIGKVSGYTQKGFDGRKPVELQVAVYFNENNEKWLLSFGSPYDYDLAGLFKNAMPRLVREPTEDFCLDHGAELYISNEDMRNWMFKASSAAAIIDRGG